MALPGSAVRWTKMSLTAVSMKPVVAFGTTPVSCPACKMADYKPICVLLAQPWPCWFYCFCGGAGHEFSLANVSDAVAFVWRRCAAVDCYERPRGAQVR